MGGGKLKQRYTLAEDRLTPEERAALPTHYVSKHGLDPDLVGGMFGYGSGKEMVEKLAALEQMKRTPEGKRMPPQEFMSRMVSTETDRRMALKYGDKGANILAAAKDQAYSETAFNVLHAELKAAADRAGVEVVGKETVLAAARDLVNEHTIGKLRSAGLIASMGKTSRLAKEALIKGDFKSAAIVMQYERMLFATIMEARRVEKEVAQFDKAAKSLRKREVKGMEPEYTNMAQMILLRVGKKVPRGMADILRHNELIGTGDFGDWVAEKVGNGQVIEPPEELLDPAWTKEYKELTVPEFRAVRDVVKQITTQGKIERQLLTEAKDFDFRTQVVPRLAGELQEFPTRYFDLKGEVDPKTGKPVNNLVMKARVQWSRLLTVETILNRWDGFDWKGPWQQFFYKGLSRGANQLEAWRKEMAGTVRELQDRPVEKEAIPNPGLWRDPVNRVTATVTRENLRAVMLNMGSRSNFKKLTAGWKVDPAAVEAWVMEHAGKEDWDFVQGIHDALGKTRDWSDQMYVQIGGVPMKAVEAMPRMTPHGEYKGGYYPLIYNDEFRSPPDKMDKVSEAGLFGRRMDGEAVPGAGYRKERTGYSAPLDLTLDRLPLKIDQQIRDAALRPALVDANRILRDETVRTAIQRQYGGEYNELLKEYLQRMARVGKYGPVQGQYDTMARQVMEFARTGLISTLVGWNPGTVMKHGATAFFLSANEVGGWNMLRAMRMLGQVDGDSGMKWRKFAYQESQELQRRNRNWQESLYGPDVGLSGRTAFDRWRRQWQEWGSKPVAMADAMSSEPTWLAAYLKAKGEGETHGDAVDAGDRAVRRAHGSTSDAAQPMAMSDLNPWFVSLYNFFNDVLNRTVETTWKAGVMVGKAKEGDWAAASKLAPGVAAGLFATVMWPSIVENIIDPLKQKENEDPVVHALKGSVHSVAAMFPVVRDVASFLMGSDAPDVGLLTTEYKVFGSLVKDLEKNEPLSPAHAEKLLRDVGTVTGALTGMPGMQIGREVGFGYGLANGEEQPRGAWGWLVGARYGTLKGHSQTWEDYLQGQTEE